MVRGKDSQLRLVTQHHVRPARPYITQSPYPHHVALCCSLIWPGAKTGRADPNTRCQQTRSIEPLAKFLVGADAKVTLAEMWRGEGLMHNKVALSSKPVTLERP